MSVTKESYSDKLSGISNALCVAIVYEYRKPLHVRLVNSLAV